MAVVVVNRRHAQSALAADQQARQQRTAGPYRSETIRPVGAKLRLIALELLSSDVGWRAIRQEHLRFLGARRTSPRARASRLLASPVGRSDAIGIDAGIDRIAEQIVQRGPVGAAPFKLALAWAAARSHRHPDVVLDQIAQHLADRSKAFEQREYLTDRPLRLLVWVQHDLARGTSQIPHRHRLAEFAPPCLGPPACQHPRLEDMQLRFRHRPLEPEQQPIVEITRVVDAVAIGDERIEQRADLEKLVPVPVRSGQARHLHPENQPDMAEADLRHQALKAKAAFDRSTRATKIIIDHDNGLARPAEMEGTID
jgi:hypothetical protein